MFGRLISFALLAVSHRQCTAIEQPLRGRDGLFLRSSNSNLHSAVTPAAELNILSDIKEHVSSKIGSKRILLVYPTIPVPFKGSDSRPIDAVDFLSEAGFEVDFLYWRDFASEIGREDYDDTPDRRRLRDAGVGKIIGPYAYFDNGLDDVVTSWYNSVLFWMWPDMKWLEVVTEIAESVKAVNGLTKVVAAVDDAGLSSRMLQGGVKGTKTVAIDEVQNYILSRGQLGMSAQHATGEVLTFDQRILDYASVLMYQESRLYDLADIVLAINGDVREFVKKVIPNKTVKLLSYVSPALDTSKEGEDTFSDTSGISKQFHKRSGYLFFGYNNNANNAGISWFVANVLPRIDPTQKLHVAGHVSVPEVCNCNAPQMTLCHSLHPNVVCHGELETNQLDELIMSSRVVINPVMEQSGVSTKTCRAMAHGTPVVVTDLDGTFGDKAIQAVGAKICPKGRECEDCFVENLNSLLGSQGAWEQEHESARYFVTEHYGREKYLSDWSTILQAISSESLEIFIDGDSVGDGESIPAQNWHMAKMLSQQEGIQVTILAEHFSPHIAGVKHVPATGTVDGLRADIVVRQSWPPKFDQLPRSFCGPACRVVQILPWEFGSLPEEWVPQLSRNADFLLAPSEYNRRIFDQSGINPLRSKVLPAGVECNMLKEARQGRGRGEVDPSNPVTFLYTGAFLPRKGVDSLLEEWETVFCGESEASVKLVLHTTYELGYHERDVIKMEGIVSRCGNVEWIRGQWMDRESHIKMMQVSDVYVAPFRSEGFGLPLVEAMVSGLAVIAPVGGTAADDYLGVTSGNNKSVYPIVAREEICTHFPCFEDTLCVFNGECKKLVGAPTWFEVSRESLRGQMQKAYSDIVAQRRSEAPPATDIEVALGQTQVESFCWSNLGGTYRRNLLSALQSPVQRIIAEKRRSTTNMVLAGMLRDAADMSWDVLDFVTRLSCVYDVDIHIITGSDADQMRDRYHALSDERYGGWGCSAVHIVQEPDIATPGEGVGRVARIKALRDFQRAEVSAMLDGEDLEEYTVVVVDLDLVQLPSAERVVDEATNMRHEGQSDVLCSAGIETGTGGYYDTFATVLLPDTWVYPVQDRKKEEVRPEEDPSMILDGSSDLTPVGLLNWFQGEGRAAGQFTVPVRSCFGGLALYRAEKWLEPGCNYSQNSPIVNSRYANKEDQQACEHVVFHQCLRDADSALSVAVLPDMQTLWNSGRVEPVDKASETAEKDQRHLLDNLDFDESEPCEDAPETYSTSSDEVATTGFESAEEEEEQEEYSSKKGTKSERGESMRYTKKSFKTNTEKGQPKGKKSDSQEDKEEPETRTSARHSGRSVKTNDGKGQTKSRTTKGKKNKSSGRSKKARRNLKGVGCSRDDVKSGKKSGQQALGNSKASKKVSPIAEDPTDTTGPIVGPFDGNQTNKTLPIGPFNGTALVISSSNGTRTNAPPDVDTFGNVGEDDIHYLSRDSSSRDISRADHRTFRCGQLWVLWLMGIPVVTGAAAWIL